MKKKDKQFDRIFSHDYSRDMWKKINKAKSKEDFRMALYVVCCRLQELESLLVEVIPEYERTLKERFPPRTD